jgi:hypothetical protein
LTNTFLGYINYTRGCQYVPTANYTDTLNMLKSANNYNTSISGTSIIIERNVFICNTSDCNSQYVGACISAELVQNVLSSNSTTGNWTSLPVYQSCSSGSSSSLPTFKLTITLGLKVNQVFISDYNNLNSAASLSFIQNFTNFVNIHSYINYILIFYAY